jgi:hypothetical protein
MGFLWPYSQDFVHIEIARYSEHSSDLSTPYGRQI